MQTYVFLLPITSLLLQHIRSLMVFCKYIIYTHTKLVVAFALSHPFQIFAFFCFWSRFWFAYILVVSGTLLEKTDIITKEEPQLLLLYIPSNSLLQTY